MKLILRTVFALALVSASTAAQGSDDPITVGKDANKIYYLIKPEGQPKHLVLTMPGGSGQAKDFLPWMKKVQEGLGNDYAVAVLSAPRWSDAQANSVVWVTDHWKKNKYTEAKFSTEEFLRAVHADAKKKLEGIESVDVFGWSSSGPAVYSAATEKGSPYDGFVILSSVFKPEQIAKLSNAKGKRFYLLQGTEDKVTKLSWAKEAEKALLAEGAKVETNWFEGGHAFAMNDPIGTLGAAFASLRN